MRRQARTAFLAAPTILAVALAAVLAGCGSAAAPQSARPAADLGYSGTSGKRTADFAPSSASTHGASGRAIGRSTAAVPPAARRVQCPGVLPLVRLPDSAQPYASAQPYVSVQPHGPVQPAEPIPARFRPVAVVECVTATSVNHGVIRIDQRRQAAIASLGPLLAALREPSTPRPRGALPACMVPASLQPWFVLVSASGQVIRPVIPVGLCGEPIGQVLASLKSLHWITLSTVALHPARFRPLLGGPIHDITPGITQSN